MNKGLQNEILIVDELNGKLYSQLNDNLKKFIKFIFYDIRDNDIIISKKMK